MLFSGVRVYLLHCLPVTLYSLCLFSHLTASSSEQQAVVPSQTTSGQPTKRTIDLNHATLAELQSLPGIGPATAKRILAYRRKNPPFRKVDDLLIIKGISKRRLDMIRDHVCVK
jgi:competence protein ComEA